MLLCPTESLLDLFSERKGSISSLLKIHKISDGLVRKVFNHNFLFIFIAGHSEPNYSVQYARFASCKVSSRRHSEFECADNWQLKTFLVLQ